MSGRRAAANNRIRGPQSALTDFLASNNISALEIRNSYERRRQVALNNAATETTENGEAVVEEEERVETPEQEKRRKKKEAAAVAKIKSGKAFQKKRKALGDDGPEGDEEDIAWSMYEKSKPLPGQLENCEICNKRFTVTAYSKTGPDGGLLCTKCSKEQEAERKKDEKAKKAEVSRGKRRKVQSDLLHGTVRNGARSLQELCLEKVADNINDVEDFGDLPQKQLGKLSEILSKQRLITSRTLDLFLRPDLAKIDLFDCGKLETSDYIKIFAIVPKLESLNLRNAGQFKDEVIDYILERNVPLRHLRLEAANLVSDEKWREFFAKAGSGLETLKLTWLDYAMDDDSIQHLVTGCPNLKRLKLKKCFRLGDLALAALYQLKFLEHLSLLFNASTTSFVLQRLIRTLGPNLRTLSLERFDSAEDGVLAQIHTSCCKLQKLRFSGNDYCSDEAYVQLFTAWKNPPLKQIDLSSTRDLDYSRPDGPDDPIGLASAGFEALMMHSGSKLERLNISSCRHIEHSAFAKIFDGVKTYPYLREIDLSFQTKVDTMVLAGLFKSCPRIAKVTAFGCFGVQDVVVPFGVALIGVPNAQDAIVQEGDAVLY